MPDAKFLIVNADDRQVYLFWRAEVPLKTGPHDVKTIRVDSPVPVPEPSEDEESPEEAEDADEADGAED